MPTVRVDGQDVFYESEGSHGPSLVFVHGFRNSSASWAPIRCRLDATSLRTWYLDLPGCGLSSRPDRWQDCTIDAYARCVRRFCRTAGVDDVVLVGHSLGGAIAMTIAVDDPDLLRGLVLVAPTAAGGLGFLSEAQVSSLISPTADELEALARAAFHRQPAEADFSDLLATVRAASPEHVEGAVRSQRDFRMADRLAEITTPTLVIAGDRDRHIPVRYTLRTAAAIKRCNVQIYHAVGHVPFVEVPDEFAALITQFALTELS